MTFVGAAAAITVSGTLAGCTTWVSIAPEAVERVHPAVVRAALSDGQRVKVAQPQIVADSLSGMVDGATSSLPLTRVIDLTVRRVDLLSTAAVFAGVVVTGAVLMLGYVALHSN